jgi:hypothetical protein
MAKNAVIIMPRWKGCTESQITVFEPAFHDFVAEDSPLTLFPGLRDSLKVKWENIKIECRDPQGSKLAGEQFGNKIVIYATSPGRVRVVLLHELVHTCDGIELDSEAIERIFDEHNATSPTRVDWPRFFLETTTFAGNKKERVGKYVIWNCETGEVWVKVQTGGNWRGGQVSKGDLCFQSDTWKHAYNKLSVLGLPYRVFLKLSRGLAKLIT